MENLSELLRNIAGGSFHDEASDALRELVLATEEHRKAGSMTITLTIKPASRGGATVVTAKQVIKLPNEAPMESLYFATPDGNLVLDNPNQKTLALDIGIKKPKIDAA